MNYDSTREQIEREERERLDSLEPLLSESPGPSPWAGRGWPEEVEDSGPDSDPDEIWDYGALLKRVLDHLQVQPEDSPELRQAVAAYRGKARRLEDLVNRLLQWRGSGSDAEHLIRRMEELDGQLGNAAIQRVLAAAQAVSC